MATQYEILINLNESADSGEERINTENFIPSLVNLLRSIQAGTISGKVMFYQDAADGGAATEDVTCTQASANEGDTLTVCGVVFTEMVATTPSADPNDGEFAAVTSDTVFGDNLEAAINAHPKLKGLVTAVNSAGTVAVTADVGGMFGNNFTLAETGSSMAVGAARLSSATVGTTQQHPTIDMNSRTHV